MLNRRTLLGNSLKASVSLLLSPAVYSLGETSGVVALRTNPAKPTRLPLDFTGLGYEMSSVAAIGLLSAGNDRYVQLIKQLGNHGVLRVGGIVADYTRYEPNGTPTADMHNTVITLEALQQFGAFLKKLNWTAIWSVNFAQGTIQEAVAEVKAVVDVLGSSLQALEIGNEVENYARGSKPFRAPLYTYDVYRAEYSKWHAAILQEVPTARFAAPDTADSIEWAERMAKDAHGDVQLLTTHYYRNGQKNGSPEQLMRSDAKLLDKMTRMRIAAKESGIPWRMCETNSFSGGGRPGVSDTLLGALWTLDFMLILAKYGCSGVNIETGVNQLGFVSSYSPIQDDGKANNSAGVPYYGMLAFAAARARCTHSFALDLTEDAEGLTAYALGDDKMTKSIVLINRGQNDLQVSVPSLGFSKGEALRLTGPSGDSKIGVLFAGAAVEPSGRWNAKRREIIKGPNLSVAKMSAVVVLRHG